MKKTIPILLLFFLPLLSLAQANVDFCADTSCTQAIENRLLNYPEIENYVKGLFPGSPVFELDCEVQLAKETMIRIYKIKGTNYFFYCFESPDGCELVQNGYWGENRFDQRRWSHLLNKFEDAKDMNSSAMILFALIMIPQQYVVYISDEKTKLLEADSCLFTAEYFARIPKVMEDEHIPQKPDPNGAILLFNNPQESEHKYYFILFGKRNWKLRKYDPESHKFINVVSFDNPFYIQKLGPEPLFKKH